MVNFATAIKELVETGRDVLTEGDLAGHIRAWWRTVRGEVGPDDRVEPAGLDAGDDPPPQNSKPIYPVLVNAWRGRLQVSRLVTAKTRWGGLRGTMVTEPARNWKDLEADARAYLLAAGAPTEGGNGKIAAGLWACPPEVAARAVWD